MPTYTTHVQPAHLGLVFNRLARQAVPMVARALRSVQRPAVQRAQQMTVRSGAVDSGRVLRSWTALVPNPRGIVIRNTAPYAGYVETGRRAGARRPPSEALVGWVQRRLGVSGRRALSVAWLVARAVGRKGIRARPVVSSEGYQRWIQGAVREAIAREFVLEMRRTGGA